MFITLEGPDGSGKTTQIRLLYDALVAAECDVLLTREPGGTAIGDQIRTVLHDIENSDIVPETEILLYSASRAQLVGQVIRPALAAGTIVLCDRYADSTMAYQGYGRGLNLEALTAITDFATGGLKPDLTLFLDLEPEIGLTRRKTSGQEWNRMDRQTLDFYRLTRRGYHTLAEMEPERWVSIDASGSITEVAAAVWATVQRRLNLQGQSPCG
ncbi:MAG: dTMP kinase [Ardenticatenales bacterium]|nr:dTMP kinase [Ardenticatenales bacterium]